MRKWIRTVLPALGLWAACAGFAVAGDCPTCGCPGLTHNLFLSVVLNAAAGEGPLLHRGIMLLGNAIKIAGGPERPEPAVPVPAGMSATPAFRGGVDLDLLEPLITPPVRPSSDASPAALSFVKSLPDR